MTGKNNTLAALLDAQADAADPAVHAWVAASAGTGKTQVLTARVLRLLLAGTRPASILCLTFTKLAATEMHGRVMSRLAHWAGCSEPDLAADLAAIRAPIDAGTLGQARALFASVLETPAGLAIQTLHSFAQGLIASFPIEAGVSPGFQTLDDRAAMLLSRRVLANALNRGMGTEPDRQFASDVGEIALDGGENRLAAIMAAARAHTDALAACRVEAIDPMLRRRLGLPETGSAETALDTALAQLPAARLAALARSLGSQDGVTAQNLARDLAAFLAAPEKSAVWPQLWRMFFKLDNDPKLAKTLIPVALDKADPDWRPFCETLQAQLLRIRAEQELWEILGFAGRHLRVAVGLAQDWQAAKARTGVIDYADMINAAARLLGQPGIADWVRFKLDARIDHVLVDEAQDTNLAQWEVIRAIAEEFFAGRGQHDRFRSLFVVGDFKQSIFGFQGADPSVYAAMREHFEELAEADIGRWKDLPLSVNFRSVPAILDVVDRVIGQLDPAAFNRDAVPAHVAHKPGAGEVILWPPLQPDDGATDEDAETPLAAEIDMARRIAATIAGWLSDATALILPASGRRAQPQDILVLVRKRGRLMNALVGALHEHGVPVAGVDRLNLSEPLAVADLLGLVRLACQPHDDLTLAALLASPFCDVDHDTLTRLAAGRPGSLWSALASSSDPALAGARAWLAAVMALAGETSPYRFLETILSGPLGGRAKLLARLGEDARDAIDSVLDQALACQAAGAPSLLAFLVWMAAEDLEIKRDPETALDTVRLLTVHGAKGSQAPIVILADACGTPRLDDGPLAIGFDNGPDLPVWLPPGLAAPPPFIADALRARTARTALEDQRLAYVALTRAQEILCIGGATRPTQKWIVNPASWYAHIEAAFSLANPVCENHPAWPEPLRILRSGVSAALATATLSPQAGLLPTGDWWRRPAPAEARPPSPLSPSSLGPDTVADPPPDAARLAAARRGTVLHRLFETLPDLPADRRRSVALGWCAQNAAGLDSDEMVATVLAVLDDPAFAPVFAAGAFTEAPLAALVGETVIAGSIDRLLVTPTEVLAVDFKTGSRVPSGLAAVPEAHSRQMLAYAAALARVFPGRAIRAALLYTAGPRLIELPAEQLAADVLASWQPIASDTLHSAAEPTIFPA